MIMPQFRAALSGSSMPPMQEMHHHVYDELLLVTGGRSTIIAAQRIVRMEAPFLVFYPTGVPHQQINEGSYSRYLLNYPREAMERLLPQEAIPRTFLTLSLREADAGRLAACMQLLMEEVPGEFGALRRTHLTAAMLGELAALTGKGSEKLPRSPDEGIVNEICMYICRHYSEPLQLHDLARRFFISRSKLIRIFPAVIGMTVGDYITGVRIACAKHALKSGMSVQETAASCGFSGAGYFIKVFRRETGMTPAEYKKQPAP